MRYGRDGCHLCPLWKVVATVSTLLKKFKSVSTVPVPRETRSRLFLYPLSRLDPSPGTPSRAYAEPLVVRLLSPTPSQPSNSVENLGDLPTIYHLFTLYQQFGNMSELDPRSPGHGEHVRVTPHFRPGFRLRSISQVSGGLARIRRTNQPYIRSIHYESERNNEPYMGHTDEVRRD